MNQQHQTDSFQYTYSATEQDELKKIRSKYLPKKENKMDTLRRLDAQTVKKASIVSIALGIFGTLVMGLGMSCCMVFSQAWFIPGIVIGVIGIALLSLAYPLYVRTLKKERERIAPQILQLTEELMK